MGTDIKQTVGYRVAMSFKPFIDRECKEVDEIVKDMARSINKVIKRGWVVEKMVRELKKGDTINHPTEGVLQFVGIATKSPFTKELKVPHRWVFWRHPDENGIDMPDYVETNGSLTVELTEEGSAAQ